MRALAVFLVLLLAVASRAGAQAPARSCDIVKSGDINRSDLGGMLVTEFLNPFALRCSDGTELRADQGTVNEMTREVTLVGNVFFQDPDRTLTAQHAIYSGSIGRLYATGNVVFRNRREGSTIRGPELEYYRAMEGRPEPVVNAGQRPHLTLQPRERRADSEPLEIDADRVAIFGQDRLSASGNTVITRTDLRATAGDAEYDGATGSLDLRQNARIRSKEYDLAGEVIQARLREGALEHVTARTRASLSGEELKVTAPDLQLFFEGEQLQRAVARSEPGQPDAARPVATARTFRLEADSLDALVPGQRLEQVVAIGRARGEAIDTTRADSAAAGSAALAADTTGAPADSSALRLASLTDRDWIVGDTVIGYFAPGDSAGAATDTAAVLKRIVARGAAQSLYRVAAQDTAAAGRRGFNYVAGVVIELTFEGGELQVAEVTGLRRGLYLDPAPPGQPRAGDRPEEPAATARRPRGTGQGST